MLTFLHGEISGSATALAANSVWGVADGPIHWWVNEPKFGFVPHGGYLIL